MISKRNLGLQASIAALVVATPAWAQEAASGARDDDVIVVTAQRRSEALEEVPMTVTVVTNQTLSNAGVNNLRDLANVTTGYQLGQGGAFPQPAIRGVTTLLNGTFENNVAVYVDGFYQISAQAINIDLPNVESIQVLKGPQGTLYGRNATGGALLLSTITPGQTWQGKAEATYARFDDKRVSGYVAGPLSEQVGVSLSGYLRRSDGYIKLASRTTPGATMGNAAPLAQDSIRAKLKFQLSDNFSALLGYNYTRISDPRGNMFTPYENVSPSLAVALPLIPTRRDVASYDIGTVTQTRQHEGTLTLQLETGIGTLKSYTGYSQVVARTSLDFDGTYANTNWSTSNIRNRTFQQAIDYSINAIDRLDFIIGGTYFHDKLDYTEVSPNYAGPSPTTTALIPLSSYIRLFDAYFEQKKSAWAVYADATYHLTDALTINAGARYSNEKQNVFGYQTSAILPSQVRAPNRRNASFSQFTPRASIRYEVAPRTNVYVSYSRGFRSGAFVSQLPANPIDWVPAKQETVDAFETGFKTARGNFRFEAAAFYYDYKNFQVSNTLTSPLTGAPVTLIANAPSAKVKGVEASFEFKPFENFTIRGGATYLHARYGDNFFLTGAGVNPAVRAINTNSDPLKASVNVTQTGQNLSGLQMSRAPNFTANLGADYLIPQGDGGLRFAANLKYTDSYVVTNPAIWGNAAGVPADRQRQQRFREGKYALLNASITWTDPGDNYYVRVWGNNLTDHRYRLHYTGNATNGTYSPQAEPLTYGVTLGYKFGGE